MYVLSRNLRVDLLGVLIFTSPGDGSSETSRGKRIKAQSEEPPVRYGDWGGDVGARDGNQREDGRIPSGPDDPSGAKRRDR